jgi:hypothetical protein
LQAGARRWSPHKPHALSEPTMHTPSHPRSASKPLHTNIKVKPVRPDEKIVLESTKYCIGVLTRNPVSIGNILEYWFVSEPTKYWNILEKLITGAGISSLGMSNLEVFFAKFRLS